MVLSFHSTLPWVSSCFLVLETALFRSDGDSMFLWGNLCSTGGASPLYRGRWDEGLLSSRLPYPYGRYSVGQGLDWGVGVYTQWESEGEPEPVTRGCLAWWHRQWCRLFAHLACNVRSLSQAWEKLSSSSTSTAFAGVDAGVAWRRPLSQDGNSQGENDGTPVHRTCCMFIIICHPITVLSHVISVQGVVVLPSQTTGHNLK